MNVIDRKVPAYLYEKSNLIRQVIFTAAFALVFINTYKPFSSENWYVVTNFMFFVYSSLIILTGVLVVVISRLVMYYYAKNHDITYWKYGMWVLLEIFFMALFYTVYTLSINPPGRDTWETFQDSIINTSLVLLLPYAILILYFSWREKERQLQLIGEESPSTLTQPVFSFYDEKGEIRLSIMPANLLYVESADNYVVVWYLNKNVITRFMLRNSLKALEEQFSGTSILRCHRSYMVNFDQVKVLRREKESLCLELGIEKIPDIPISKTYHEKVIHHFIRDSS